MYASVKYARVKHLKRNLVKPQIRGRRHLKEPETRGKDQNHRSLLKNQTLKTKRNKRKRNNAVLMDARTKPHTAAFFTSFAQTEAAANVCVTPTLERLLVHSQLDPVIK